tara:strand:- start:6857 stop:9568 length:2712 start_codon:yes stop_codon:yes gene_type:complete
MNNTEIKNSIFLDIKEEKVNIEKYSKSKELFEIPDFVKSNLKNELRDYQIESLENLIFLKNPENKNFCEDLINKYKTNNNHFLYHMATGSGKTMIMAANIIYLYSLGYKRFIFTTNQTNLISKTKLNLLKNLNSPKCEFKNDSININSKKVQIKEVENFSKYSDDIEIIFTTIHTLHNNIKENKENSINLNDIKNTKVAILADEAHHFQTQTKLSKKSEKVTQKNWENTVNSILKSNNSNILIEYTATMNVLNNDIFKKYKSKIIYDYTLKSFREDGYSKEITLVTDKNKESRILQSVIINQYRYLIAEKNNIYLIPKILFKSVGTIENLKEEVNYVFQVISKLNIETLNEILKNNDKLSYINSLNQYFENNNKENFISLIKRQFTESNSLVIHSKDKDKSKKLEKANSLDKNDKIRIVFSIDILNEGWDVLSLFDIVKLDEPDNKNNKTTTKEVQLIGRGARIFPYNYKNEFNVEYNKFKRKFDHNTAHELRFLENMMFYSSNENSYIKNIKTKLIEEGLIADDQIKEKTVKVKPKKELSEFAQFLLNKFVFTNKLEFKYGKNISISDYDINIEINKNYNVFIENVIGTNDNNKKEINKKDNNHIFNIKDFIIKHDNLFILSNCINKLPYFSMNNIVSKFPIKNKDELIKDLINLGNKISIVISGKKIEDLNYLQKTEIIIDILVELSIQLDRKSKIRIGGKNFKNKFKIKDTFIDYSKQKDNVSGFNEKIKYKGNKNNYKETDFTIMNENLFYYSDISWDSSLELELYNIFDKELDSEKYLVIRNEVGFKMYNPFTKNGDKYLNQDVNIFELNGDGFEPDFIVLKKCDISNKIIQFFIEVKGLDKVDSKNNKWKEKLLIEIKNEEKIIEENIEYKIYGLPFFTENDIKNKSIKQEYLNKLK